MRYTTTQLSDKHHSKLTAYLCEAPGLYKPSFLPPAVILCPGGAFLRHSPREAEPVALRFVALGYSAFVLEYPVGDVGAAFPDAALALAQAVCHVRRQAEEYHIDPECVSVCGFSAGGHVCATLAAGWNKPLLCDPLGASPEHIRPDAAILCYPVIDLELQSVYRAHEYKGQTHDLTDAMRWRLLDGKPDTPSLRRSFGVQHLVDEHTTPCFLWHTADDLSVSARNSLTFAEALASKGVAYELHIYQSGVHGLSLANSLTAETAEQQNPFCAGWFDLCAAWLQQQFNAS